MRYVIDIDGTICTITDGNYGFAEPIKDRIDKINLLYDSGNVIIFHTARGMNTFNSDVEQVNKTYYKFTKDQLEKWGVKYHKLIMGKPSGDIYIDDKGVYANDFFK
jgi:capsule biosynthesis phosphatase